MFQPRFSYQAAQWVALTDCMNTKPMFIFILKYMCCSTRVCVFIYKKLFLKKKEKKKRPGSSEVLTVSTGLCAWPRLWSRQDGLQAYSTMWRWTKQEVSVNRGLVWFCQAGWLDDSNRMNVGQLTSKRRVCCVNWSNYKFIDPMIPSKENGKQNVLEKQDLVEIQPKQDDVEKFGPKKFG